MANEQIEFKTMEQLVEGLSEEQRAEHAALVSRYDQARRTATQDMDQLMKLSNQVDIQVIVLILLNTGLIDLLTYRKITTLTMEQTVERVMQLAIRRNLMNPTGRPV